MAIYFAMLSTAVNAFEKVIIWGHKLHSHTHSYIHNGFYKAFSYLGYPTYWFDDNDDVSGFDFSGCLFLTEGQVDKRIPILPDCQYMLHNCTSPKYYAIDRKNRFNFQVYTDDVLRYPQLIKLDTCQYYDVQGRCVYIPWATDLLPEEIDAHKKSLQIDKSLKQIYWVGTIGGGYFGNVNEIQPFIHACQENGINFIHKTPGSASIEENIEYISNSYIAPAIVGKWQKDVGYIPCRIFKNISYGKMGVTNSQRVYELFEGKIVYNPDPYLLFYDAKARMDTLSFEEMLALMDFVRDKHTYLNRIQTLLSFFDLIKNE
jgi:hypothetical protein